MSNHVDYNEMILSKVPCVYEDFVYRVEDGIVVIPTEQNHKIQKVLRKLGAKIPAETTLKLDDYSSSVFLTIDGKKTIEEIGVILEAKYGEEVKPVYERLILFIEHLAFERKWVYYITNDIEEEQV